MSVCYITDQLATTKVVELLPMVANNHIMKKTFFISIRLNKKLQLLLYALVRRSGKSRSKVIRELILNGYVKERISKEHIQIIRQLAGEATNLNQLAKKANTFGFKEVA